MRGHFASAPDVLVVVRRVEAGYSVRTVVVPSKPTVVLVLVVSPRVVVVVETVTSCEVVVLMVVEDNKVVSSFETLVESMDDGEVESEECAAVADKVVRVAGDSFSFSFSFSFGTVDEAEKAGVAATDSGEERMGVFRVGVVSMVGAMR